MSVAPSEVENRAQLARVTCGQWKPDLPLEALRTYFRDVHSFAIARRPGIYEYRTNKLDLVRTDLFEELDGVEFHCPPEEQLHFVADVRYLDRAGLDEFFRSPDEEVRGHLLADLELLNARSTTYLTLPGNARTYVDHSGDATSQGPVKSPTFAVFFRQRSGDDVFREEMRTLAGRWSEAEGVRRVRLSLFERPDMEAEKRAGYPVKTHPVEQQHQAWIDLVLEDESAAKSLLSSTNGARYESVFSAIHTYPVLAVYTFVYAGKLTLVGLRGYPAYETIERFGASNQTESALLEWLYGEIAKRA